MPPPIGSIISKWTFSEALSVFSLPFPELIFRAQNVHQQHHNPSRVQISTLLSIKTGACPENCSYCPQSGYHKTGLKKEPLMEVEQVLEAAKRAKASGATRFCMGAAWRGPKDRDLDKVCEMVAKVKQLGGLETCATLGLLKNEGQAQRLKKAGLDFYNHNIDCSKDFYHKIITTRRFDDRISTIEKVRSAGIKVCCGGIIGMGENNEERVKMLVTLANFAPPPESVPINKLMPFPGTPLANAPAPDPFDFVRTIATARVLMPMAYIRLSAGREQMADELQALCFLAGANSLFFGEKLLTASNPMPEKDKELFQRLGLKREQIEEKKAERNDEKVTLNL
uniref:biotin synthase n=1 Tax=Heterodera glycines TaxID=51029 RepID=A0A6M2RH26_HETGL|nr:biotin synthase [Heterodera glycines]